ncbi:MAG: EVE domain-containing protein [Gemmatimonadaceae bacterium]
MNTRNYWLVKSEPESFSFEDLWRAPRRTTQWDGVRNYQARNLLRDQMKKGDPVFFYHSNGKPPTIAGVAEVAKEGYPDPTAFDPRSAHFDGGSDPNSPRWYMVDLRATHRFKRPVTLPELRNTPGLGEMVLLRKGSRLSVQPVTRAEWDIIYKLGIGD